MSVVLPDGDDGRTSQAQQPAAPQPPAADVDFEGPSRWVTASDEVRKTALWTATALAAAGAVIFGAGPLIARTELDAASWPIGRITLCIVSAVIGILGVVLIVGSLVSAQLPIELTIASLPESFKKKIQADPRAYLPGNCTTVDEFRTRLRAYQTAEAELPNRILATQDSKVKKQLEQALSTTVRNAEIYRRARNRLLAQGKYEAASAALASKAAPVALGRPSPWLAPYSTCCWSAGRLPRALTNLRPPSRKSPSWKSMSTDRAMIYGKQSTLPDANCRRGQVKWWSSS